MYYKGQLECSQSSLVNPKLISAVSIRLMLFAPFHSEIIIGKVIETTPSYVRGELFPNFDT
jgi:DNA-directed RNA polymerase subunit E'/Rpb7